MAGANDLELILRIRTERDANGLNQTITDVRRVTDETQRNNRATEEAARSTGAWRTGLSDVGKAAAGVFAGFSIAGFTKSLIDTNGEMQTLRTSLETITGSASRAGSAFQSITDFASKTPFQVNQVTQAFIALKNQGLAASEAALTSYGNTASAMGKSLDQVVQAVADATHGQFDRLIDAFGINASKSGDKIIMTFKGIDTAVQNDAQHITEYLQKIGNTDFAGGMERQSKTMQGAISNLRDSWDGFLDHIISTNGENAIAKWVQSASEALGRLDIWLNSATKTKDKIYEIDLQIDAVQKSLAANANNGAIGGLIDGLTGYDPAAKQRELDKLLQARAGLVGSLREEASAMADVNNGYKDSTKAAADLDKVSSDKINIEQRYKTALEGSYKQQILNAAQAAKINSNAMLSLAALETNSGKNIATSSAGARGIMQIMPPTASALSGRVGLSAQTILTDNEANITASAALIKEIEGQLKKAGKLTIENVAAAYNAGMPALVKAGYDIRRMSTETIDYASNAGKLISRFEGTGDVAQADKYEKISSSVKNAKEAVFEAVTAAEKYDEALTKNNAALAAGTLSADGWLVKINLADDAYQKAIGATDQMTEAIKRQDAEWKQLIANANELDSLRAGADNTGTLLIFAQQLQLAGLTTDEIRKQVDLQKQLDNAVASHPNQDPSVVKSIYADRINAEKKLGEITKSTVDQTESAYKRMWENMQDTGAKAFINIFSGAKGVGQNFMDSIADYFEQYTAQRFSAALKSVFDGVSGNTDWSGLAVGVVGMAVNGISALLSKSVPATTPSVAQQVKNPNVLGGTQMAIADAAARSVFTGSTLESIQSWNNALNTATSLLRTNVDAIASYGSELLSTVVSDIWGTGLGKMWTGITNYISTAYESLTSMGSELLGGVKGMVTTASNYLTSIGSTTTEVATGAATSGAATGQNSLGALSAYAGAALSILQLGYNLYEIAGQKYSTVLEKVSQSLGAAAMAAASVSVAIGVAAAGIGAGVGAIASAIPVIGWVVAAALQAASVVMEGLGGDLSRSFANGFGGHIGTALWDAMNKKDPSATVLSMTSPDTTARKVEDPAGNYYVSSGGRSGSVGGDGPFGQLWFRINEVSRKSALMIEEAVSAFLPLIRTVTSFDKALAGSIHAVDMLYGQDTLSKFKMTKEYEQPLAHMDSSKFISQRLTDIANGLGETGTKAGEAVAVWWNAFSSKLLDPAKDAQYNTTTSLNIETFIAAQLPKLVELPTKLASLFVASVKSVADGATQAEFEGQMNDFFAGWTFAKEGLKQVGIDIEATALPDYLASLTGLGMTVKDSAVTLVAYAKTFDAAAGDVSAQFNAAFNKIFENAKAKGASSAETSGYINSYLTLSNVAKDAKLSVTPEQLDATATSLNNLAIQSTQSARAVVDHAIATANLGAMSRDAAVQQLTLTGALTSDQAAAEDFTKALAEQQSAMLQGISFASQLAYYFNTTIGNMGLSFNDVTLLGGKLTQQFGDLSKAMSFVDGVMKAVLSPTDYSDAKQRGAQATFSSSAKAAGLGDNYSINAFKQYAGVGGQYYADLEKFAGTAKGTALQNLGAAAVTLTESNAAVTQSYQSTASAADTVSSAATDAVNKQKALADAQQTVNDRLAELAGTSTANSIAAIDKKIQDLVKTATENGGSLAGLDSLRTAELVALFKPLKDEFDAIGQTDYAGKLKGITDWSKEMTAQASVMAAAWGLSTDEVIADIDKVAATRKAALDKERDDIIRNANQTASRAGDSQFTNSLWAIRDQFVTTIQSAANAGATYDQLLTIAAQGATAAGRTLAEAQKAINATAASKNNAMADKLYTLQGGKDLNGFQQQRALADLQSSDLDKQAAAVDKLIELNDQRYQAEIGNVGKIRDYLTGLLQNSTLSALSPEKKMAASIAEYQKNLAGANKGDQNSFDKLGSSADAVLTNALANAKTKTEYDAIFYTIKGDLENLAGVGTTEDKVKAAQLQQVTELQGLQQKLQTVTQAQTTALIAAFDKVGTDFVNTLQAMAGPTKNVKDDINMKIVGDAAPDSFANFKKMIVDVLASGVLTPADGELLKNSSLHLVANLAGLIVTQEVTGADAAVVMDASTRLMGNLGKLVSAQMITPEQAVSVYDAELGIFDGLTGLLKKQLISPDAALFVYTAQTDLVGSLTDLILAHKITAPEAGGLLGSQNRFVNNLIDVVGSGQISQESGGRIYMSQYYLIGDLVTAINSSKLTGKDVGMITGAVSGFSDTVAGQLKTIKLSPADNALYSSAVTEMSNVISSSLKSNKFSPQQIGILTTGLTEAAKNPAGVLSALNFSPANLATLTGSLTAAADNPAKVFELLGFSSADQQRLAAGLGTLSGNTGGALAGVTPGQTELQTINQGVQVLATNMHDGLADVQFLKQPGDLVRAGVSALAYNIGGGLGSVGIDNSPVNSAVNNLMEGIAAQVYSARNEASRIVANANAAAASASAISRFDTAFNAGDYNSAAQVAKSAGFSNQDIANQVASLGGNAGNTMEWLRLNGYASGGRPTDGYYIAGENGAELIVNGGNDFVYNANQTRGILNGGNGGGSSETDNLIKELLRKIDKLTQQQLDNDTKLLEIQKQAASYLKEIELLSSKNDVIGMPPVRAV